MFHGARACWNNISRWRECFIRHGLGSVRHDTVGKPAGGNVLSGMV